MRHGQTVTETPRAGNAASAPRDACERRAGNSASANTKGEGAADANLAGEPEMKAANAIGITAAVVLAALGSLFAGLSGVFLYLWGFSPLAASLFWIVALAICVWAFLTVRQIIRSERKLPDRQREI